MKKPLRALIVTLSFIPTAYVAAAEVDPGREAFRAIYEEMVEIDSSATTGSCTKVVRAAETRLKAAGFTGEDMQLVIPEGKPDDGNIVARIRAGNATKKGVLLLAHIDVVDAKREDWERDPFTLVEEDGYFFGRGSADDKSMAAVFLELMIRLKQERNFKPRRDLIMALTCGEETSNRVNGVDYILKNHRDLIDAAFAINEGAGGLLSAQGKPLTLQVQAGEKIHQVYSLEVTHPRRAFFATAAGQRDLSARGGDAENLLAVVSRAGHSGGTRVLSCDRADPGRRDRCGDERHREES